ncbi:TPR-like protein [Colletotrichum falcatum]|nr:TPR-like protein [Colletotrichum falcatum]
MVVDNADDVNIFYPKPSAAPNGSIAPQAHQPLASLLPQSTNGKIVVTSRNKDVAERLTGSRWNVLCIDAMDEDQAHQLLRNKLQEANDEEVAAKLLQALEYMPLAITQAAAYILRRAPRMSPSTYLADFRKSEKKKASLLNRNMGDLRRDPSASNSIVTTWQITFDYVRQERQSAADLLAFLSYCNPQGIPEWILESYHRSKRCADKTKTIVDDDSRWLLGDMRVGGAYGSEADNDHGSEDDNGYSTEDDSDLDKLEDDLSMLREFSLVTVTTQKGMVEMHPLVRFCTQIWLSTTEHERKWRRTFLHVMSRLYPVANFENWARCQELDPHTQSVVNDKPENKDDLIYFPRLLFLIGWYKMRMGKYKEAEQLSRQALKGFETISKDHPGALGTANQIAFILQFQGKYKESEQLNRQVLEAREKIFGTQHDETHVSLNYLAAVLQCQGKYKEAEQIHQQVLEAREKTLGRESPTTLKSLNNLAAVLQCQGKHKEAETIHQKVLEGRENSLGKQHPTTLTSTYNLATALHCQGKHEEAERLFQQAVEGRENCLGKHHPDTLLSIHGLATALSYQGKYNEAEKLLQRAVEGREKALGEENSDTLESVHWLAYVYEQQCRFEDAYELYNRALSGKGKVLGSGHSGLKVIEDSILFLESQLN